MADGSGHSRGALWLAVVLYAGGAAVVAALGLLAGTLFAPELIGTGGPRTRVTEALTHVVLGAAFGALAVGRVRRDGAASGGSRAMAAAWLGAMLGAGALAGGTLVDVMDWSRRAERGLPALVTLAAGAAGAWLIVRMAGSARRRRT